MTTTIATILPTINPAPISKNNDTVFVIFDGIFCNYFCSFFHIDSCSKYPWNRLETKELHNMKYKFMRCTECIKEYGWSIDDDLYYGEVQWNEEEE